MGNCISEKPLFKKSSENITESKSSTARTHQVVPEKIKKSHSVMKEYQRKSPIKQFKSAIQSTIPTLDMHSNTFNETKPRNNKENIDIKKVSTTKKYSKLNLIHTNIFNHDIFTPNNLKNPYEFYKKLNLVKKNDNMKLFTVVSISTDQLLSLKQINIDPDNYVFKTEMNNLDFQMTLEHPNIIKFNEHFSFDSNINIVNEYSKSGFLSDNIETNFNEYHAGIIIYQLFNALNYLNNKNISHRNIKPENIFISDYKIEEKFFYVKISDFRTSKIFTPNQKENDLIGSGYYIAPEILKGEYDEKCDVWTLGIIFYSLIEGCVPFIDDSEEKTRRKILNDPLIFSDNFGRESKNFLSQILNRNTTKRLSSAEALNHQFFVKLGIKEKFTLNEKQSLALISKFNDDFFDIKESVLNELVKCFKTSKSNFEREILFNSLSKNMKEKISLKHIKQYFQNLEESILNRIQNVFDKLNQKGQKSINFYDFLKFTLDSCLLIENTQIIYNFIKSKSGVVNYLEISKIMKLQTKDLLLFEENKFDQTSVLEIEDFTRIFKIIINSRTIKYFQG